MAILSCSTIQGRVAALAAGLSTLGGLAVPSLSFASLDQGSSNTSQIDNQNKVPEKFGKAAIPIKIGSETQAIIVAGANEHFFEPKFPFVQRTEPATDPFQTGDNRSIVLEVTRSGDLAYVVLEILLTPPWRQSNS